MGSSSFPSIHPTALFSHPPPAFHFFFSFWKRKRIFELPVDIVTYRFAGRRQISNPSCALFSLLLAFWLSFYSFFFLFFPFYLLFLFPSLFRVGIYAP